MRLRRKSDLLKQREGVVPKGLPLLWKKNVIRKVRDGSS